MTTIQEAASKCGLTEEQAMNILQDNGQVSDNCVTFSDIYLGDMWRAAEWLLTNHKSKKGIK